MDKRVLIAIIFFNIFITSFADINDELIKAAQEGDIERVKDCIDQCADVNAKNNDGITVLMEAAWRNKMEIAKLLMENGADINAKDDIIGGTALIAAAFYGHADMVELLIFKKADVNIKDNNNKTALDYAEEEGHKEVVELLQKIGAKRGSEIIE